MVRFEGMKPEALCATAGQLQNNANDAITADSSDGHKQALRFQARIGVLDRFSTSITLFIYTTPDCAQTT